MTDLLNISDRNGQPVVSARELYEFLGLEPAHWRRWYTKNILRNQFAKENEDWEVFTPMVKTSSGAGPGIFTIKVSNQGGRPSQDFALTLDFAKRLSMLARTEKGEQIRRYFIAKEEELRGQKQKAMSPAEWLLHNAQLMVEQEKRLSSVENKLELIEAKTSTRPDYFTVVGYAVLHKIKIGLSLAAKVGAKAKRLCKERGLPVDTIPDPRFGKVGSYPSDVLQEAFAECTV